MPKRDADPRRRALLGLGAAEIVVHVLPTGCWLSSDDGDAGPDGSVEGGTDAGADAVADVTAPDVGMEASPCPNTTCVVNAGTLVVPFAQYPALAAVGGSILLEDSRYHDPACGQDFVIVAQPTSGTFVAFQGSCTHACCAINFTGNGFTCPCHGSTFDLTGQVTSGPAPTALQMLSTCADGCGVFVQLA